MDRYIKCPDCNSTNLDYDDWDGYYFCWDCNWEEWPGVGVYELPWE